MNLFSWLVLGAIGFIYVKLLSFSWFMIEAQRRRAKLLTSSYRPFVSILKPVKDLDAEAYENFASFCLQNYPRYEIIFGVADADDAIVPVIRRVIADHPHVPVKLIIGGPSIGENPKVNNLYNAYQQASGEVIILSDSDVCVGPDYLAITVAPLAEKKIGVVTGLIMVKSTTSFWGNIAAVLFNGTATCVLAFLHQLGMLRFAWGASIAMRREVLEEVGVFSLVANSIADDITLATAVYQRGYSFDLLPEVVQMSKFPNTLSQEWMHTVRWLVVLRVYAPACAWTVPLYFAFPLAFLNWIVWPSPTTMALLVCAITSRIIFMMVMSFIFVKDRKLVRYAPLAPMTELLFIAVWLQSLLTQTVVWRGIRYRIFSGGRMEYHNRGAEKIEVKNPLLNS